MSESLSAIYLKAVPELQTQPGRWATITQGLAGYKIPNANLEGAGCEVEARRFTTEKGARRYELYARWPGPEYTNGNGTNGHAPSADLHLIEPEDRPAIGPISEYWFECGEKSCGKTSPTYAGLSAHIRKIHERPPTTAEKKKVLV
jgi:hypothetical protein